MWNGKNIIPGIIVFLGIAAYPFLHNNIGGRTGFAAMKPEIPQHEKECVEPAAAMRIDHKDLLDRWMTSVVRGGTRTYEARSGKRYPISLSRTCMRCHADKAKFCDRCHEYLAVFDDCWDCHVYPKQTTSGRIM